jgi:hypothetical protein
MSNLNYLHVILFVMEIINVLTDSVLLVLYILTSKSMAMDRICEAMFVEFSIVVVDVMYVYRSLTYLLHGAESFLRS